MLQRSPTYFLPNPNANELADILNTLDIPDEWTHEIVRKKILLDQEELTRRSVEEPEEVKAELLDALPDDGYAVLGEDPWLMRLRDRSATPTALGHG